METFDELYYREPYAREFDARVTSCTAADEGFAIELDQTAFYPTGGGQPGDRGTLTVGSGEDALVVSVREAIPGKGTGEVIHLVDATLPVGASVHGSLDWTWRRDNMEAHTGEHIISGIVHALFGYNNVGFHMGERCIEVDFDGVLTPEDVLDVERRANAAVREDVRVEALLPSPDELASLDYRSKKDHEGQIRVVRIAGVDSCACCGTHVSSTGQVGLIKILRLTTKKKRTRLELLCGRRALEACEKAMQSLRETSNFLTVGDEEVPEAVRRLSAEKDELKHQLKQAGHAQIEQFVATLAPKDSLAVCCLPGLDVEDLRYLCECVLERTPATVCAGISPVEGDDSRLAYVMASSGADLRAACKELNARLGGRGGGKPQMVQGSWATTLEVAESAIREILG
ncbi:alanyl-tRNA synthetase [Olsenella sp. KH3B4]|uniref:alanyl-tRNA editing protein n=1 Tax=Olsenella sp. KH3B4 TaxID=1855394 RepID=UPI0008ABB898|nr:alanyl-tRNA editing protein [Olsenella sp. KH3B4]SES61593.1 alanyl-tRNA synthetase [Olsenella sp. KH3B4]